MVQALQGAWSAIVHESSLVGTLKSAVRGGRDTDTVAAIAGSLAGAVYGGSALPGDWRRVLHGWPGLRARDLSRFAILTANGGRSDELGWPAADRLDSAGADVLVQHPHDAGVWLGSLAALDRLPGEIDAVVSLCRVSRNQTDREVIEYWLIDRDDPEMNPNLSFVLGDAADTVAALRAEGRMVLVHCVEGRSR
nr:ADP-ribosylglycohydrolase family protein [Naasia sp. SYSU D00948]